MTDIPKPDIAICYHCGKHSPVEDCEMEQDQETWEMPVYWIHICPHCGEAIDDYTWSDENANTK